MNLAVKRQRLEMQGFHGLDDQAISELGLWLRFTPAICAMLAAVATVLGSVPLLIALGATALFGAVFPHHPFDFLYDYGVRYIAGTRALPPNRAPRRFACAFATLWLALTTWAFAAGAILAGRILGAMFVGVALVLVLTDFCVPSFLFQLVTRRSVARQAGAQS
jgi:hypothetical protein